MKSLQERNTSYDTSGNEHLVYPS